MYCHSACPQVSFWRNRDWKQSDDGVNCCVSKKTDWLTKQLHGGLAVLALCHVLSMVSIVVTRNECAHAQCTRTQAGR